ncbi:MAG: integrase [Alphaproteobacteria bacterium]|nr:integrase [Alphaproteobacteria bacterium]
MVKLTKRYTDAIKPDPADKVVFDEDLAGFGLRVKPSGAKSWLIQYRNTHNRSRRYTLGPASKLTPDQARKKAIKLFVAISEGIDPASDRGEARNAQTVAQLCDDYLEAGQGRIKPSTLTMDKSRIERHVKPLLGTRPVASLTHADLEKFLRDVMAGKTATKVPQAAKRARGGQTTGGAGAASRTLGMLGTILERAVRDGVLAKNPARGVARPKDGERRPGFEFETIAKLGLAIRQAEEDAENAIGLRAIRLLLLSGCRRMEILGLTWETVDTQNRCLRFKDTKSGAQIRPLGRAAIELLLSFRPPDWKPRDFVFPGASKTGHFIGLPRVWERIARRAGINGVSIHGLRHWFASAATAMGYSELVIAGMLGHRVKGVTARYATAPDSALLAAADSVAGAMASSLLGTDHTSATVLQILPKATIP